MKFVLLPALLLLAGCQANFTSHDIYVVDGISGRGIWNATVERIPFTLVTTMPSNEAELLGYTNVFGHLRVAAPQQAHLASLRITAAGYELAVVSEPTHPAMGIDAWDDIEVRLLPLLPGGRCRTCPGAK